MKHLKAAYEGMSKETQSFIAIHHLVDLGDEVVQGVNFQIQSAPVSKVGVDGVQVDEIIEFAQHLLSSLNEVIPSDHNDLALAALQDARTHLVWRRLSREARHVEGKQIP